MKKKDRSPAPPPPTPAPAARGLPEPPTWAALALVAAASFLVYSNIFGHSFVFDSVGQIEQRLEIRDLDRFLSPGYFLGPRRVVDATFALNFAAGGLNAFGYHLVNVIIHALNGFLVYSLALRLVQTAAGGKSGRTQRFTALAAALIFAAHPVQTQAVTYTVQRYASMAALFYLAAVLLFLEARVCRPAARGRAVVLYAGCFLCGALAVLSKQNAASLPLAVGMTEYLFFDRTWKGWRRKLTWLLPGAGVLVSLVLYQAGAFTHGDFSLGLLLEDVSEMTQETTGVSRWQYLCTQFGVITRYIGFLLFPAGQSIDHMVRFKNGFFDGFTPLAFLFLAALAAGAVWQRNRRPVLSFAVLWFFITLSVESSIFPIRDALFEHRLYLPLFGFALAAAWGLVTFLESRPRAAVAVTAAVVVSLGLTAHVRNRVYRDHVTLWSDVVAKNPQNPRGHYNLATALALEDRMAGAARHFSRAIQLRPRYAKAHYSLAHVYLAQGRLKEARQHFEASLRLRPRQAEAHFFLGKILASQGELAEAGRHFGLAARYRPRYWQAYHEHGVALAKAGRFKEAAGLYLKALALNSKEPDIHFNLGVAYAEMGALQKAVAQYQEALRLKPGAADVLLNLGVALARQGRMQEAKAQFAGALEAAPDSVEAHLNLAMASLQLGELEESARHFARAAKLAPGSSQARRGLERTLRELARQRATQER